MTAPDSFDSPDGRTCSTPETAGQAPFRVWMYEEGHDPGDMSSFYGVGTLAEAFQAGTRAAIAAAAPAPAAPGARPLEQLAIAAYGAWIGHADAERVLLSWRQGNTDREAWRAAADAVRMMLDMPAHPQEPQPQAAPGRERDALQDIARAAQGSIDTGPALDRDWVVERPLEGLGWLPEGWPKPQAAPELAAAMTETRLLRELAIEMLATFGTPAKPGTVRWTARQVAKWRERAGLHP